MATKLSLSQDEVEFLTEAGINTSRLYIIKRELVSGRSIPVDCYNDGQFCFFLGGTMDQHVTFLKFIYGEAYKTVIHEKRKNITIYGSPTQQFMLPTNLIVVETDTGNSEVGFTNT